MSFEQMIQRIQDNPQKVVALATLTGCVAGYVMGRFHAWLKNEGAHTPKAASELKKVEDTSGDSEYEAPPRGPLETALRINKLTLVQGTVTNVRGVPGGYAGIISDAMTKVPFYFDYDSMPSHAEEGLVRVLLDHAEKTGQPVEFKACRDEDFALLKVETMRYALDGTVYKI
ncbi:hypothetical protein HYZ97_02215 [Candidatus Pacearchaeota archaeon]|nr:hypothetical protein [Candidatus Pacearchaeota archaeon]